MEKKLNVCLMNDSFPPAIDGVANATINYANVISSQLGETTVVTPSYPNVEDNYPFDVLRYKSLNIEKICGYRAGYPFSSSMLQALTDKKFDIIHSHCPWASTVMARVLREKAGVPIVLTYHTKFDVEISRALPKPMQAYAERFILGNIAACDKVWTVSNGARENLLSIAKRHSGFELDGSKIDVVENGVDFPQGRAKEEYISELLSAYGISTEYPLFLFVGRLMWYKGIKLIMDALKTIKERGRDYRMMFVGDGADRQEMEAYAEEIGIADRCIFAGAVHDREELRVYYSAADLFLFPSEYDTNGIVVREAAACGVGSLLIEGSCAAEGIEDGRAGILTKPDASAIAEKLDFACTHRTEIKQIGEHAMNEVYLSWETAVKRAYALYPAIIENRLSGSTERRESFVQEEFISFVDTATDSIQRLRSIPVELKDDFKETRDKFKMKWHKIKENINRR